MRYMGIDYGTKRIGIALSDEDGTMAFPYKVVENTAKIVTEIKQIIADEKVEEIVIGHSLNQYNKQNTLQQDIEQFILDLTLHIGIPIHLEPEQYTTQEAIRVQGRSDKTDASAATIILNSYFSKQHKYD